MQLFRSQGPLISDHSQCPISCSHADPHLNTANQTLRNLLFTAGGQASHVQSLYFQALQLTPYCHGVLGERDS